MRNLVFVAVVLGLLLFGCVLPGSDQGCGTERAYVCGEDGNTYTNACYARASNVRVAYEGQCAQQNQTSQVCTDSDNGKNALEAGVIAKGNVTYNDSCASTTAVFEYYCTNNEIQSERVDCPEGTECSGGRCAAPLCNDSDNGQVANVFGTVVKGTERHSDECADANTVREYYCSGNSVANILLACPSGTVCTGGVCNASACTDTDGGSNLFERGTVREGENVYIDYCSGTASVKEYYCSNGSMVQTIADCGDGFYCSDGRCLEYACRDTDGGRDENEFGTVSKGSDEWPDECYDENTVKEYYCNGNDVSSTRIDCGSSEICSDGQCVRATCSDSDGGNKRGVFGTVSAGGSSYPDSCTDLYNLREYFCSGSSMDYADILCTGYGELCWNNACSPAHCEDSDGGRDKNTFGSVRVWTDNGYSYSESDSCIGDRSVSEKFCSDLKVSSQAIACAGDEVCSVGRCVEATCTDSDGGRYPFMPGTATKGTLAQPDECKNSTTLKEYYCSGNEITMEEVPCGGICMESDGMGYCSIIT